MEKGKIVVPVSSTLTANVWRTNFPGGSHYDMVGWQWPERRVELLWTADEGPVEPPYVTPASALLLSADELARSRNGAAVEIIRGLKIINEF